MSSISNNCSSSNDRMKLNPAEEERDILQPMTELSLNALSTPNHNNYSQRSSDIEEKSLSFTAKPMPQQINQNPENFTHHQSKKIQQVTQATRLINPVIVPFSCIDKFKEGNIKSLLQMSPAISQYTEENLTYPYVAVPTNTLIKKIALNYKVKYDIQIELCSTLNLRNMLQSFVTCPPNVPFGIIVHGADNHVTPLLCDFSQTNQGVKILCLDIVNQHPAYRAFLQTATQLNIPFCLPKMPRQADNFSCRTEALTVLRNALLDIKRRQADEDFAGFESITTLNIETDEETEERSCDLPPEWDYTDQLTNPILRQAGRSEEDLSAYKTVHGSKGKKYAVTAFRAAHREKVTFAYKVVIEKARIGWEARPACEIEPSRLKALGDDIKSIQMTEKDLIIEGCFTREIDTYLIKKGFRNVVKEEECTLEELES